VFSDPFAIINGFEEKHVTHSLMCPRKSNGKNSPANPERSTGKFMAYRLYSK